jgi:hypothetical protein
MGLQAVQDGRRRRPYLEIVLQGSGNPIMIDSAPSLLTVRQFVAKHRAFTEPALRKLIFEAAPRFQTVGGRRQPVPDNGLGIALLRVGRRVLIDEGLFFEWLGKHRAAGPRRLALEVPARRRVAGERV